MKQLSRCLKGLFQCMTNTRAGNTVRLIPCVTKAGKLQSVPAVPVLCIALANVFPTPAPGTLGVCHTVKDPCPGERLFFASCLISWVSVALSSHVSFCHTHTCTHCHYPVWMASPWGTPLKLKLPCASGPHYCRWKLGRASERGGIMNVLREEMLFFFLCEVKHGWVQDELLDGWRFSISLWTLLADVS